MISLEFEFLVFFILIFCAGFLTAAEIAIASFGEHKINELKEKDDKIWKVFNEILNDPEPLRGTIQVFSIILVITSAIIGFFIFAELLGSDVLVLNIVEYKSSLYYMLSFLFILIVLTAIITVFGFLIPKSFGFRYSNQIGRISVKILVPISKLMRIPINILSSISNIFLLPFKEKTGFAQKRPTEDEILGIISDGVKSGTIDEEEQEIIKNIFEFTDRKAKEVMVPRTSMIAVDIKDNDEAIFKMIANTGHTLLPVYDESLDNIIGILHSKDLIRTSAKSKNIEIEKLLRPAYFIPEIKLISEVLRDMQKQGERLAIVTDEYGGTEGVITMEDILEEIVGDLKDKAVVELKEFSRLPDGKYYVLGSMQIEDFNDTFNFQLPESDEFSTVAGFVAYNTGKILTQGEIFDHEGLKFELIKKIRQKMVQFRVYSDDSTFGEK